MDFTSGRLLLRRHCMTAIYFLAGSTSEAAIVNLQIEQKKKKDREIRKK